jgi:hypothetical protein
VRTARRSRGAKRHDANVRRPRHPQSTPTVLRNTPFGERLYRVIMALQRDPKRGNWDGMNRDGKRDAARSTRLRGAEARRYQQHVLYERNRRSRWQQP